jgi:dipeptidyl-peptidase-4
MWFSERDGWDHLYLYNTEGKLLKQMTQGDWVVTSFNGFDDNGDNFFITATKESPVERHYYKVEVSSGNIERITNDSGVHSVKHNYDGSYFIDNFNNLETPRKITVVNEEGNNVKEILNADNPLENYSTGDIELFTTENEEGTKLYGKANYPPNFDASKKYPLIVYVYGGPHAQLVYNSFPKGRYDIWSLMMAQKGYIVIKMDNRGSANRGVEFEQSVHRQLGTLEVEDQLAGLNHFIEQGFIDTSRIGVFGWSYGGFMTTSLLLCGNDMYKVGVGGGAVIDWKFYEVMYTERYMDTPESNPEGYEKANLLNHIDNLKGKDLLLVHGTSDDVVVWQQTLRFAKEAASKNLPLDYYPYPGHGHGVGGRDALHLYNKITDYFLENL